MSLILNQRIDIGYQAQTLVIRFDQLCHRKCAVQELAIQHHPGHAAPLFLHHDSIFKERILSWIPSLRRHFRMQVKAIHCSPTSTIPNSPLPLLYYSSAFSSSSTASQMESKFRSNGWIPQVCFSACLIRLVATRYVPRNPLPFNYARRSRCLSRQRTSPLRYIER
jgi:hypothetical protein